MKSRCTLVFARAPVPGKTKTRLITALGAAQAARLHELLLRETVIKACQIPGTTVQLWCTPDTSHPAFAGLAQELGVGLFAQEGADLGCRMQYALDRALEQSFTPVLIGTDCPDLTAADLREAHTALEDGCDAVLGPAQDGGYVLIGMRSRAPGLFEGIAWGSNAVLQETRNRLASLGHSWHELPQHRDVDRPEDLEWLRRSRPDLLDRIRT